MATIQQISQQWQQRKHTADDIEWQTEPQLYSAVHKKPPPTIPATEL